MRKFFQELLGFFRKGDMILLTLCLTLQVSATDGAERVPEENIVYKQDMLYLYVAPAWDVKQMYCQVQYGADNSFETIEMTPVEGKEAELGRG